MTKTDSSTQPLTIVLAEDSALLREGLRELLSALGHEVHTANDADHLKHQVRQIQPDIVVTDVRMPPEHSDDGLRAAHDLRSEWEATGAGNLPVVVLSQYVAASYLDSLLEHGGFGYLLKERIADVAELNRTLGEVVGGGIAVDPEVISSLLRSRRSGIANLTPRETEVLELMARGLSNGEIQQRLVLTAGAVSKHVANVFMKLGFSPRDDNRRVKAVLLWLRHH